jgi:hypothetical protein
MKGYLTYTTHTMHACIHTYADTLSEKAKTVKGYRSIIYKHIPTHIHMGTHRMKKQRLSRAIEVSYINIYLHTYIWGHTV